VKQSMIAVNSVIN